MVPDSALCRCSILLAGFSAANLYAQTQAFDAYTYSSPPGYTLRTARDHVELSKIDQQRRSYCQIALYTSQPSLPSANEELDREWRDLVTRQFRVKGNPSSRALPLVNAPSSQVRAAEAAGNNGATMLTSLFLVRFPARYLSVVFNTPNAAAFSACQPDVTSLLTSLRMNGAARPPATAAVPISGRTTLAGSWQRIIASQPSGRYNMFTKTWEFDAAAAGNQFKQIYTYRFASDGTYTYQLDAENFNRQENSRIVERGTYTVANGAIQFQVKDYRDGTAKRGQEIPLVTRAVPASSVRRFLIGEHPKFQNSAGLQLQTQTGEWETYKAVK